VARASARAEKAELTSVAWSPGSDLPYEEWLRVGGRLGVAGRSAGWWLGDWLRYGTARYGTKYTAALRVTGYDRQTLMNMVYVATRFDASRRRESLSWSHHAELAGLEAAEQDQWLERACADRLTVRELRLEIHCARRQIAAAQEAGHAGESASADAARHAAAEHAAAEPGGRPSDARRDEVTASPKCPHCGRPIDPALVGA
jgi:hypothetical protein